MKQEQLMTVVLGPHLSEKSTRVADKHNQIVFKVRRDADKDEIRRAVELLFDVKVVGVRVINMAGKPKRFGRHYGHRPYWKKAYVTLAEGEDIDFLGME